MDGTTSLFRYVNETLKASPTQPTLDGLVAPESYAEVETIAYISGLKQPAVAVIIFLNWGEHVLMYYSY